jgi:hypothetical protein
MQDWAFWHTSGKGRRDAQRARPWPGVGRAQARTAR